MIEAPYRCAPRPDMYAALVTAGLYDEDEYSAGPHMVHSHTVHLPLGALLSPCTMCGTGAS